METCGSQPHQTVEVEYNHIGCERDENADVDEDFAGEQVSVDASERGAIRQWEKEYAVERKGSARSTGRVRHRRPLDMKGDYGPPSLVDARLSITTLALKRPSRKGMTFSLCFFKTETDFFQLIAILINFLKVAIEIDHLACTKFFNTAALLGRFRPQRARNFPLLVRIVQTFY